MRRNIGARLVLLMIPLGALLSMVLYAWSTGFISVSCDEFAKTVIASRGLSHPSEWFTGIWLPLHFVLIAGTSLVTGDQLLAARLVSIAFGVLLILALFGIGRQFGGNLGGALAAIVGATHPLVALLSATAMVDICYVAMLMMGLRFLLKVHHSPVANPIDRFVSCGFLTLACAFHYNAWIAVVILAPFLVRSLYRTELRPSIVLGSLLILGSVPCAWVVWNWVHRGKPLAFFSNHSEYSAHLWSHLGWHASPQAAVFALYDSLTVYSPLLAILAFSSLGTLVKGRAADQRPFLQWALLLGFFAGLIFLYSTGGRPAAFEPRYILLPSVLMVSIASGCLVTLWRGGDREVRAFVLFLSIGTVVLNLSLFHETIDRVKQIDHYDYTREARKVAAYMRHLKSKNASRLVLEVKKWNFLALSVFVNRADAVVTDRELINDSVRHFDNPSVLLGSRDPVLAQLRAKGVGFIAAWSPAVQNNIESWGLHRLAKVDTYTLYQIPRAQ
jgi:4-amino-4-deoxy-L-arabinose transferase-like glycosyltransferase